MPLISIQILRALAALSVAVGHAQAFIAVPMQKRGEAFDWSFFFPWNAGVDLFFVISGFIMVHSSEQLFASPDGARRFMTRRLARIVPLYWLTLAFLLVKLAALHKPLPGAASALASFLFFPWPSEAGGVPRPFYELGWTLNYEMFFYALFALAIGFRRDVAVALVAASLIALTAIGVAAPQQNAQIFVWTQAITLEFSFGMGLALLARRGATLAPQAAALLAVAATALLLRDFLNSAAHPRDWETPNDLARVFAWGLPSALLVAAAVLARAAPETAPRETPLAQLVRALLRAGAALGDASYALYLSHPIVMSGVSAAWFALRLDVRAPAPVAIGLALSASVFAALILHRLVEKPITRRLQQRLRRRETGAPALASAG